MFWRLAILAGLLTAHSLAVVTTDLRLIDSIKNRDRATVETLLHEHVNVNAAQPDGATALAWAVYLDQPDMVDLLMAAGAKVDTADQYGETPLTLASATGNYPVMQKLLAAGADAKAARFNNETALMIAARTGTLPGVKLLVEHGANVNAAEEHKGQTALMWAAAEGHGDVVNYLIQRGADVHAVSKGGFTPLVFAVQKGDAESTQTLLTAGLSPDYTLPNQTAVLHVAVAGGKPDVVAALLDHDAQVNVTDKTGNTPLHLAAQEGELEIVRLLLAKKANPNFLTAKIDPPKGKTSPFRIQIGQQTALLLAAKANHVDVMRALIDGGADPKIKAQDGTTLLMAAAASGHLEPVKYAYELDPGSINDLTTRKSNAIHAAVTFTLQNSTQANICEVLTFLNSKGADLDAEDINGRTPIVIADILPIDEAVTLLTKLITDSGKTPKKLSRR